MTRETVKLEGVAAPIGIRVVQGVAARPAPLVLHLPGGTFMGMPADRPVAGLLAEAGAVVVSADYPAGAAHPFPQAVEACFALLCHLHRNRAQWAARRSPLFVAGEEAGGNLAAALTLMARDRLGPPIAGQILLSPMLDAGMATCSFRDAEAGPVGCKWADGWTVYLGRADAAAHPYAVPARRDAAARPAAGAADHHAGRPDARRVPGLCRPLEAGRRRRARARPVGADWPDALAGSVAPEAPPDWAHAVRTNIADFFAAVTPGLVPAPALTRRAP